MATLISKDSRVAVYGMNRPVDRFHVQEMTAAGTQIAGSVASTSAFAGMSGVPPLETLPPAGAHDLALVFGPASVACEGIKAAALAGYRTIICASDHIPASDWIGLRHQLRRHPGDPIRVIGSGSAGIIVPGVASVGTLPEHVFARGTMGVVSAGATSAVDVARQLQLQSMGVSTCVDLGRHSTRGTGPAEVLSMFEDDPTCEAIILAGFTNATETEDGFSAARLMLSAMTKPVVAVSCSDRLSSGLPHVVSLASSVDLGRALTDMAQRRRAA